VPGEYTDIAETVLEGTKKKSDLKISPEADGTRSGAGMPLVSPPDSARVRTSPDSFRVKLNVHNKE